MIMELCSVAVFLISLSFCADPENALYDDLDLRRGVKETFFSISTPLAFLDRFTKKDGMKDLIEVLSKWNKGKFCFRQHLAVHFFERGSCHFIFCVCAYTAFYIPPKQEQAFLQGGTFIFDGPDTVYAHYDESTAAHANVDEVIKLAMSRVTVPK